MLRARKSCAAIAIVVAAAAVACMLGAAPSKGPFKDSAVLDRIIEIGSSQNKAMMHLDHLVNDIGPRPAGSQGFMKACNWARDEFGRFGLENVHLEEVEWNGGVLYNVVADIRGAELPDEYVIVGAHTDAVPGVAGATDDGVGVAAVMEAARILAAAEARPRRTVRFVLFGGEEVGLVGSKGYLASHPEIAQKISAVYVMDGGGGFVSGIAATAPLAADLRLAFAPARALQPEQPFLVRGVDYLPAADPNCCAAKAALAAAEAGKSAPASGCGGAGASGRAAATPAAEEDGMVVKRVTAEGDTIVARIVLPGYAGGGKELKLSDKELDELGITVDALKGAKGKGPVRKTIAIGSSDHAPFLAAGIPAFQLDQDSGGSPSVIHSKQDTYDAVAAADAKHSALVIAIGAYGTANLDHLLSREKLAAPAGTDAAAKAGVESAPAAGCGGNGAESSCSAGKNKKQE